MKKQVEDYSRKPLVGVLIGVSVIFNQLHQRVWIDFEFLDSVINGRPKNSARTDGLGHDYLAVTMCECEATRFLLVASASGLPVAVDQDQFTP